jgi:hypothetical protein
VRCCVPFDETEADERNDEQGESEECELAVAISVRQGAYGLPTVLVRVIGKALGA